MSGRPRKDTDGGQKSESVSKNETVSALLDKAAGDYATGSIVICAFSAFVQSLTLFAAAGTQWLASRYFIHKYGSILYPSHKHFYDSLAFAVISTLNAVGGYYLAAFGLSLLRPRNAKQKLAVVISIAAVPCLAAAYMAKKSVFASGLLAATPAVCGLLLGIAAAFRTDPGKRPFNNLTLRK
ncbi:MAG: hypothetical protein WCS77_02135 [Elusimicrobiaceae bacterium]